MALLVARELRHRSANSSAAATAAQAGKVGPAPLESAVATSGAAETYAVSKSTPLTQFARPVKENEVVGPTS